MLHLNKNILSVCSEFFRACFEHEMRESTEGIVRIDDNEELMTELLRSMYSDNISIPSSEALVDMILLAQKYHFDFVIPSFCKHIMANPAVLKDNVLKYMNINLEPKCFERVRFHLKRVMQESSSSILTGDELLTLDIEPLINTLDLIVNNDNFSLSFEAIYKWIEVDEEKRAPYTYALLKTIREAINRVNSTQHGVTFDPTYCSTHLMLSHNNKRVLKDAKPETNRSALGTKCNKFSIRLIKNCGGLMVGMAPRTINKEGRNWNSCGWYLHCGTGCLFSQDNLRKREYMPKENYAEGTIIEVELSSEGDLSYTVDGEPMGVAYQGLKDMDLYPAFDMWRDNCEFEFL